MITVWVPTLPFEIETMNPMRSPYLPLFLVGLFVGGPMVAQTPAPKVPPEQVVAPKVPAGVQIQWFATLDRGLAEAKRTGKPILFVSAAPHCAGVSGMW